VSVLVTTEPNAPETTGTAIAEESFYDGALGRIRLLMLILGLGALAIALWEFGRRTALGFFLGCAIAYFNFHWLKSAVAGVVDRVSSGNAQSGAGIVGRFLLRYVLLGMAAYGILTSFPASLRGLFAGLFLPVVAIFCEAVYELYTAICRGL
jgi:ATP synthase I chain